MNALTLDLGNSALKLASWRTSAPSLQRVEWGANWEEVLRQALRDAGPSGPHSVALSSVVAQPLLERVADVCRASCALLHVNPEPALEVAVAQPASIGRDRLYAAAGAWSQDPTPALVLDAGTALTVDALGSGQRGGCFLGGAIAPGPALLASGLGQAGAQLFEVELEGPVPALGQDTRAAMRAGLQHGFRGAAAELVARIGAETGLADSTLWLTGGACEILRGGALFGERRVVLDPWLVHRGLLQSLALSR